MKWSDNPETETGLTDQLGRHYLLKEGLTHGIYLVGWVGSWRRKGGRKQTDAESLRKHLETQCDQFCTKQRGRG